VGQKQTKLTRTSVEDLTGAWLTEHPWFWLGAAFVVGLVVGVLLMEAQLAHAGLL
jgi:ElaB/YqjD/DUF883 family membrane-anchored ribosome-binding protein